MRQAPLDRIAVRDLAQEIAMGKVSVTLGGVFAHVSKVTTVKVAQ